MVGQTWAAALYVAIGAVLAFFGLRYDRQKRPGLKSEALLFVEFFVVTVAWPLALLLAGVSIVYFKLCQLHHKKGH